MISERSGHDWRRPAPESSWPVFVTLVSTMVLQASIPDRFTTMTRWPLIALEFGLLVFLVGFNPIRFTRHTKGEQFATRALLAVLTADNTSDAFILNRNILAGRISNDAPLLLGSGAAIYVTNVLVFGLWYWHLDRGGPTGRLSAAGRYPAFMFPQMSNPELAPTDWAPAFLDYLYISVSNVMAFSPSDVVPLARWAKVMMTLQAMVALVTLALVFARAVNVLG